jgi:hypothetical protein
MDARAQAKVVQQPPIFNNGNGLKLMPLLNFKVEIANKKIIQ